MQSINVSSVRFQFRVGFLSRFEYDYHHEDYGKSMLTSATQLAVAIPPRHLREAMPERYRPCLLNCV